MRTIYSLKEFKNAVDKIAWEVNPTYRFTTVRVEMGNDGKVKFECYVNDKGWHEGATMEECLQNLRTFTNQVPVNNIDVEIDMEEETKVLQEITSDSDDKNDIPFL